MLKIYVCEDNEIQRETISTIIKNYLSMNDFDALFFLSTNDPEEVLTNIDHARGDTGLYFLDVDLNASMNGIELGAQIRKKDPGAKIVFITAHIELTYLTFCYKVEPLDYFSKDNREDFQRRIIECIDISMERYYNSHSFEKDIFIKSGNSRIKVNLYDIEFVESSHVPHRLTMHLDNRRIDFYGSLKVSG